MKEKQPSVFGKMRVLTEDGIDAVCRDIERRERAGEKPWTAEDHRRLRQEVYGSNAEFQENPKSITE
jgi:hypothetical protein